MHDADAIVVVSDAFADDESHSWDWQLRPENGVDITIDTETEPGQPLFTLTAQNGAAMSGFVLDDHQPEAEVIDGTLRLSQTGTEASFTVVLATSDDGVLTSSTDEAGNFVLDGRVIDPDALADTPPSGLPEVAAEPDDPTDPPTDPADPTPPVDPTTPAPVDEDGAEGGQAHETESGDSPLPSTGASVIALAVAALVLLAVGFALVRRRSLVRR